MNIQEIYKLAIKMGIENDFRSEKQIKKQLKRQKENYEKLPKDKKEIFDMEKLTNPYSDSRIHFDNGKKNIKKIMAGIDIDTAEIMLAEELDIENIIAHHPIGLGLAGLDDVMHYQADILEQYGVPINVAESLMKKRISEVSRGINPENHYKEINAAKLLNINLINVHTPADNLVAKFVENKIKKDKPEYVGGIIKSLLEIPEYKEAAKKGFGPVIFSGSEENRTGKIALTEITGGTSGSKDIYEKLSQVGVGTVIGMHMSEEYRKEAEKYHINVVIAGHISSDSLGMNLFLDELEKRGIEIVPCSGLIRVNRNKKKK
ncbi:MAG TPA: NGG1p interacting factor NIF3 [Candidatus Moranbacteria bacterium]|nr:NGG1p interacting factor NIF3 [Candidatus Moranbacteria bacterium]HRZ34095.1 NGG1p interacting factor NIF3 [Candidatus Moranbacteria bacterium]